MNDHVTVLGTKYTIRYEKKENCNLLGDSSGICDTSTKTIYIANNGEPTPDMKQDIRAYERQTLRHEIVHAFMHESGLSNNGPATDAWPEDEPLMDWIAIQHSKLHKAFKKAGAL